MNNATHYLLIVSEWEIAGPKLGISAPRQVCFKKKKFRQLEEIEGQTDNTVRVCWTQLSI